MDADYHAVWGLEELEGEERRGEEEGEWGYESEGRREKGSRGGGMNIGRGEWK